MAGLFGVGGPLGPVSPGLSGAVNPLAIIGAGIYQNNPLAAFQTMGNLQQAGQQLQFQQLQNQQLMQRHQAEMELKRQQYQDAQALRERQRKAAMGLVPSLMRSLGPNVAEEQLEIMQQGLEATAEAYPQEITSAALSRMTTPSAVSAGQLSREEITKEFELDNYTPQSVRAMMQAGAATGGYDPSLLQTKPATYGFDEERKLAAEVDKKIAPVRVGVAKGLQLLNTLEQPGPIADVASLYGLVGTLDPGSVIRESETALVQSAIGLADRLKSMGQQVAGQGFITDDMREEMRDVAKRLMQIYKDEYEAQTEYWRGVAGSYRGVKPERVMGAPVKFPDLTVGSRAPAETPAIPESVVTPRQRALIMENMSPRFGGP